jgi:hypothetical protein
MQTPGSTKAFEAGLLREILAYNPKGIGNQETKLLADHLQKA